jgi:hypothetical protein
MGPTNGGRSRPWRTPSFSRRRPESHLAQTPSGEVESGFEKQNPSHGIRVKARPWIPTFLAPETMGERPEIPYPGNHGLFIDLGLGRAQRLQPHGQPMMR